MKMFEKLQKVEDELFELNKKLSDPAVIGNQELFKKYAKRRREIEYAVSLFQELKTIVKQKKESEEILKTEKDGEFIKMAKEELEALKLKENDLMKKIESELLSKDPYDGKDSIIEVRAGTGGEEAALFAGDLARMYMRYAERHRFKVELMSESRSDTGGYKEIIFAIRGNHAYGKMKYESGVHRVQRIPVTEAKGRIHTSTATVVVLPEAEEVDMQIKPDDLRIDTFRAGGHGGQHVQKTESAVRITHIPTGIEAKCQDERSQGQNKEKAMRILRTRLLAYEEEKRQKDLREKRISQIGTGERSEKIRTYNFPQDRVTDHRIKVNFSNLPVIMDGSIDDLIAELEKEDQAMKLAEFKV